MMLVRGIYRKILLIVAISALLNTAMPSDVYAKLAYVDLAELVEKATFIAYGETYKEFNPSLEMSSAYVVRFNPHKILKNTYNAQTDLVRLCNEFSLSREAYDFRTLKKAYFVFASKKGDCLKPVWQMNSVVLVTEGVAATSNIVGQPEKQELNDFMDKIKALVELENKQ